MLAKTCNPPRMQAFAKFSATELIPLPWGPPIIQVKLLTMLNDYSTLTIAGTIEIILLVHNPTRKAVEYPLLCGRDSTAKNKRSEEHTSELQSRLHLVCRLLLEKKKSPKSTASTP